MCSPLKGFLLIVPLWCAVWLHGVIHTIELDFPVWCTLWSLTLRWDAHRGAWLCGIMHTLELDYGMWCTPWSFFEKLGSLDSMVWCTPWSFLNTFFHDSAVWCTPWSQTRGMMQTGDHFKNSNISAKCKLNSKILLYPVYPGPRWVQIMKKIKVENLVTHSL